MELTQGEAARAMGYNHREAYAALEGGAREPRGPVARLLDLYELHGRALAEPFLSDGNEG